MSRLFVRRIKDRPHYRRTADREENTLAINIAGRFRSGIGEEGGNCKYLLVAAFKSAKWNWLETQDEADEEKQKQEKEKDKDVEDACYPQDPIQEIEKKESEE